MTQAAHHPPIRERQTMSLWFGCLLAPLLWAGQLVLGYALVPHVAGHPEHHFLFHVVTVVFFLLTLGCGAICLMEWRRVRFGEPTADLTGPEGRTRFLAALG